MTSDESIPDIVPAAVFLQDLNAKMRHADLIYVREAHRKSDQYPVFVFHDRVYLPADVAGWLVDTE